MQTVPPERMPGERKLEGHAAYEQALDELIENAEQTIRLFDRGIGRDFNAPRRYDLLRKMLLARRTNRVYIVLHETANLPRDCPRLISLVRQFSHALFVRQTLSAARRVYDPFAVADESRFVHRFHYNDVRGEAVVGDLAATRVLIKRFDEIWEAATPAAAATTMRL
jgi:hypothetical protein